MTFDDNYDHEKDHDKDYIIYAIHSLIREIQNRSLKEKHLKAWFNCHIWSSIFNQAFGNIDVISIIKGKMQA
ncbi:hypothetical protein C1645_814332 [Glomus cerebriforme]|uniref:Uncharacterized protein n=1 Tax=Glomus cerebriforme TaxID=658196 RepID=A0A397TQV4_9GLOM|nr:hypothetical protein C1645_814332 [Glomus cerebriforme]